MKWNGLFLLPVGLLAVAQFVRADEREGEKKAERWVECRYIGQEIYNLKKELELTPEQAGNVFQKEFPRLKAEWRDQLPAKIELAPGAFGLPDQTNAAKPTDTTPFAGPLRFSPTYVVVVVLRPEGSELWHHNFDCLACLKVRRSAMVDALFDIGRLEKTYGALYKGVKQGDNAESVVKALGKAGAVEDSQAVGYFQYYYFKDDIVITFLNGGVQKIEAGVPESVKKRGDKER